VQFPAVPDVPRDQRASGVLFMRYEDIAQDGRVLLTGLPQAVGLVVWRKLISNHAITQARNKDGVIPILTRLVVEGGGGPVSVMRQLEAQGGFQLAHTVDAAGKVNRIVMNIFVGVDGTIARTAGPPPENHGQPVHVGRVFAEHVFTRLFAPPDQRKVLSLAAEGVPAVPPARYDWTPPESSQELPPGATWLEDAPSPDEAALEFGLTHTDSNQHVNSLAYPRLFEEAGLRRLARLGESTRVLARFVDIAYRKPCFAGDRMRFVLRAFRLGDRTGCVGRLVPDADHAARPHTYVRMAFAV
jgi:hypothetical protein